MKLGLLLKAYNLFRSGKSFGDAAALKACGFTSKESGELAEKALALADYHYQAIDPQQLAKMPQASLGFNYYKFLLENDLHIMNLSAKYHEYYIEKPVTVRYVRIHDFFHVLTGFDASVKGELGVYAFAAAQNFSSAINKAYRFARTVAPLIKPLQYRPMKAADKLGWEMGKKAEPLILYPFENNLQKTLFEVRQELNIPGEPQQ